MTKSSFEEIKRVIKSGRIDLLEELVDRGAELFDQNTTALHICGQYFGINCARIMQYLLNLNALDPLAYDNTGRNVLDVIRPSGATLELKKELKNMVKNAAKLQKVNAKYKNDQHYDADFGVREVVNNNYDPNKTYKSSRTTNHFDEVASRIAAREFAKSEDSDIKNKREEKRVKELEFLSKVEMGELDEKFLKKYLEEGGRIDASTSFQGSNNTALHIACKIGDVKMVALLLEHGAYEGFYNKQGKTPYQIAKESGCNEITKFFDELPKNSPKYPSAKSIKSKSQVGGNSCSF